MRLAKVAVLAALVVGTILGLLWATGALPAEALRSAGAASFLSLAVLIGAAAAWSAFAGPRNTRDETDRPVP